MSSAPIASARSIPHRGWEAGADVFSGRVGEYALYFGGFQGNRMVAARRAFLDETATVPCAIAAAAMARRGVRNRAVETVIGNQLGRPAFVRRA